MACRGWFTGLLEHEASEILHATNVDSLLEILNDLYKLSSADDRELSVDKSWDAMHRVLCGGWLDRTHGDVTMRSCVIGARQLSNRDDWIISYVEPPLVKTVAGAIANVQEHWFREQYFLLNQNPKGVGIHRYECELNETDFEYTWSYFSEVKEFYRQMSERDMTVVFAVDQ